MKNSLADYLRSKGMTRDPLLTWHVESTNQRGLIGGVMDDLLKGDKHSGDSMQDENSMTVGKADRNLGTSNGPDRPGVRPAPHGENVCTVP